MPGQLVRNLAITLAGEPVHLPEEAIAALRSMLRGALLRPGDEEYGEARHIWNGLVDKLPALIVRCQSAPDEVMLLAVSYPKARAQAVLRFSRDYMRTASESLSALATLWNLPASPDPLLHRALERGRTDRAALAHL